MAFLSSSKYSTISDHLQNAFWIFGKDVYLIFNTSRVMGILGKCHQCALEMCLSNHLIEDLMAFLSSSKYSRISDHLEYALWISGKVVYLFNTSWVHHSICDALGQPCKGGMA